mgnify:CR=1 FL=1
MRNIKKFESFVNDQNRMENSIDYVPRYNPVNNIRIEEYVDNLMKNNYKLLFTLTKTELPKNKTSDDFNEVFDKVRDKAIEYYKQNPEAVENEIKVIQNFKKSGQHYPTFNNLGGHIHAGSLRVGE